MKTEEFQLQNRPNNTDKKEQLQQPQQEQQNMCQSNQVIVMQNSQSPKKLDSKHRRQTTKILSIETSANGLHQSNTTTVKIITNSTCHLRKHINLKNEKQVIGSSDYCSTIDKAESEKQQYLQNTDNLQLPNSNNVAKNFASSICSADIRKFYDDEQQQMVVVHVSNIDSLKHASIVNNNENNQGPLGSIVDRRKKSNSFLPSSNSISQNLPNKLSNHRSTRQIKTFIVEDAARTAQAVQQNLEEVKEINLNSSPKKSAFQKNNKAVVVDNYLYDNSPTSIDRTPFEVSGEARINDDKRQNQHMAASKKSQLQGQGVIDAQEFVFNTREVINDVKQVLKVQKRLSKIMAAQSSNTSSPNRRGTINNEEASLQNNQIIQYRAAVATDENHKMTRNDESNVTANAAPILTIKHYNGQITVESEVKSNSCGAATVLGANETTVDLQRLLNVSSSHHDSPNKRQVCGISTSFDIHNRNAAFDSNTMVAIDCSPEEQDALGRLFRSMQRTYIAMQKVRKKAEEGADQTQHVAASDEAQ